MVTGSTPRRVVVGKVRGVYGVGGWLRVQSYTEPSENILTYSPWWVQSASGETRYDVASGRRHGLGVVARLADISDRDAAKQLVGATVTVQRSKFALTGAGEFYWADLEGLAVRNIHGQHFGHVDYLIETGANDVMVVAGERERLIPYLPGEVVLDVDLDEQAIRVDWDPDF